MSTKFIDENQLFNLIYAGYCAKNSEDELGSAFHWTEYCHDSSLEEAYEKLNDAKQSMFDNQLLEALADKAILKLCGELDDLTGEDEPDMEESNKMISTIAEYAECYMKDFLRD